MHSLAHSLRYDWSRSSWTVRFLLPRPRRLPGRAEIAQEYDCKVEHEDEVRDVVVDRGVQALHVENKKKGRKKIKGIE